MNAALKIAVPAEDGDGDEIILLNGCGDGIGERAAVADAGGAAVTDEMEFQFFEKRREAGGSEIVRDDFGPWREARLYPGFHLQAALEGFFGEQAGTEHQRGIRCVRATGDGGDDHGAAGKIERVAIVANLDVLRGRAFDHFSEGRFGVAQRDAILRALRSGDGGLDGAEIEFELVAEKRIGRSVGAEQRLFLAVAFDNPDFFYPPA